VYIVPKKEDCQLTSVMLCSVFGFLDVWRCGW